MGTLYASAAVDEARYLLQDLTSGGTRWLDAEMVLWFNAAQREVSLFKPDASVTTASITLTVAVTKQTLPTGANHLIAINRNMGADGATPGKAIRLVDMEVMNAQNPDWHTDTASTVIKHYLYDKKNPTVFWVYPAAHATTQVDVEAVYAIIPAALVAANIATGQTVAINVPDIYYNGIVDYMVYRALSKDSTYTKNGVDPELYYRRFLASVGAIDLSQKKVDPNELVGNPNANQIANRDDQSGRVQ
jgi:hypothetical protein